MKKNKTSQKNVGMPLVGTQTTNAKNPTNGQPQGIAPTKNIKTKIVGVPLVGTQKSKKINPTNGQPEGISPTTE